MRGLLCGMIALLALASLLAGCSTTTLSGSWKDPEYRGQIRKVYIVGVARQELNRRIFEDTFSRELATLGVTGIASYQRLSPEQLDNKDALVDQVGKSGADSILMARMTNLRVEQVTSPGYVSGSYFAPAPYYRSWDSYYERRYEAIYQPPTVTEFQGCHHRSQPVRRPQRQADLVGAAGNGHRERSREDRQRFRQDRIQGPAEAGAALALCPEHQQRATRLRRTVIVGRWRTSLPWQEK